MSFQEVELLRSYPADLPVANLIKYYKMETIQDIWKNALTAKLHENKRQILRETFPILKSCSHKSYLSIIKYLEGIPERFYEEDEFNHYLQFLLNEQQTNKSQFENLLKIKHFEIDKALFLLNGLNQENWHDSLIEFEEYALMGFLDTKINPIYLKVIESIYFHFVFLIASSSRLNRGTPCEGLDVYNCVEEIKRTQYSIFCKPYDNVIRNAIAHGGITYKQNEIIYQDKKGNFRNLGARAVISLVDNLLDVCNAFALAIKLFFISNLNQNIKIPRQFMIEELQAETDTPWWHIEGSLISSIARKSQLVLYAKPNTRDHFKVHYSCCLSAVLCEQFAPGFDRYFFSLRSLLALPGWAAFDGKKLQQIREKGPVSMKDYKGILENNLLFFVPKLKLPRFLYRIQNYLHSFRLHWPLAMAELRSQFNLVPLTVRQSTIHRAGLFSVLNGAVILYHVNSVEIKNAVRKSCRRITRKALKTARKKMKFTNIVNFLPLGYVRLSIFKKNFRRRKLINYGLGSELVCTIEKKKIFKIKVPDIFGSKIEIRRGYKIAWNKSWLESLEIQE